MIRVMLQVFLNYSGFNTNKLHVQHSRLLLTKKVQEMTLDLPLLLQALFSEYSNRVLRREPVGGVEKISLRRW
jgi:hypothetical protein